jgi:hypothetical protein
VVAVHEALARANFERDVAVLTDGSAARQRLIVHERTFPVLDATVAHTKSLRLRMQADDWDDFPPSIALLKPDGSPWTDTLPGGVFSSGAHPSTGRPFICMRGAREYHTHPSHVNERWENFRGQDGMGLVGILMQLSSAWRKAVA